MYILQTLSSSTASRMNKSIISNDFFSYFFMYHLAFFVYTSDFGRCVSGSHIVISRCYKLFVLIGSLSPSVLAG